MVKHYFSLLFLVLVLSGELFAQNKVDIHSGGYPITPVPFTSVKVVPESFWGQRLKANREVTIPFAFRK